MCSTKTNGTRKESITRGRGGQRPLREEREEGVINPRAVATDGVDQRQRTLSRRFPMVLRFQSLEVERTRKMKEIGSFFSFFFFFLYHIFVVKVQEIAWSASYGENKTQNPKRN